MKNLALVLVCVFATVFSGSEAQANDGYAYRYDTTYGTWDETFSDRYGYEESYYRDYSDSCGYRTCYYDYDSRRVYRRTRRVYVEETVMERGTYSGYTRVTVYRNSSYADDSRYVTYYTRNGRVTRRHYHRRYHRRPHFVRPTYTYSYTYDYYTYPSYTYVQIDEATANIIAGIYLVAIGADVATDCAHINDDEAQALCLGLAAGSSLVGSSSIAEGVEQNRRKTELALEIEAKEAALKEQEFGFED